MKKKLLSVLLCATMVSGLLAGCGSKQEETAAPAAEEETTEEETTDAAEETTEAADTADASTVRGPGGAELTLGVCL